MKDRIRQILIVGYGNIGQALSPLLRRRFGDLPMHVVDERMTAQQIAIAAQYGMAWTRLRLMQDNFAAALMPHVGEDALVINVATSVGSRDLIGWTQERLAFYLDTCIDPWSYQDGEVASAANTNHAMRETVLRLQREQQVLGRPCPTAVVAHGANPGLVSLLVKEALLTMSGCFLPASAAPGCREEWALLAEALGVRVIQISERDTQHTRRPREPQTFVNTWSVDGFVAEALQPVELGWGSHEAAGPMAGAAHFHAASGSPSEPPPCGLASAYFRTLGAHTRVRSWSPAAGDFTGWLISHNEALSLASYLTIASPAGLRYRPTVYYAYYPCDQAAESLALLADGHRRFIEDGRVLKDEIDGGIDELGVLLLSDRHPSLWLGSQLSIHKARELAPHNNATSLQVVGSMMAAIEWMQCHPRAGIIESEALDHDFVLAHARRYWEPIVHQFRHWHPEIERHPQRWTLDEFVEFRPPVEPTSVARALETAAWPSLMRMKECGQDAGRSGDAHLPRSWPPFDERR